MFVAIYVVITIMMFAIGYSASKGETSKTMSAVIDGFALAVMWPFVFVIIIGVLWILIANLFLVAVIAIFLAIYAFFTRS